MEKKLSALEALKRFRDNIRWLEENTSLRHYFENDKLHFKEDLDIIETALKRLEEIDNRPFINGIREEIPADVICKKLKALEIIKEKNIDITLLHTVETAKEYKEWFDVMWKDYLKDHKIPYKYPTKKEFDLLKEVLK